MHESCLAEKTFVFLDVAIEKFKIKISYRAVLMTAADSRVNKTFDKKNEEEAMRNRICSHNATK